MYPLKTENTFLLREIFVFFSKVNLGYILRVNYTCLATTGSLKAMPRCPLPPHFIPEPPLPRCLVSSLFSPLPLFHFSTFSFRKHKTPPTREFLQCKAKTLSSETAAACNAKFPSARTARRQSRNSPSRPLCRPARARLAQWPGSRGRSAG